jgi:hypothetical protein
VRLLWRRKVGRGVVRVRAADVPGVSAIRARCDGCGSPQQSRGGSCQKWGIPHSQLAVAKVNWSAQRRG